MDLRPVIHEKANPVIWAIRTMSHVDQINMHDIDEMSHLDAEIDVLVNLCITLGHSIT